MTPTSRSAKLRGRLSINPDEPDATPLLAPEPVVQPAAEQREGVDVIHVPSPAPHAVRLSEVALNPKNTRRNEAGKVETLAESIRIHGQLQPSTVVHRESFLEIFPECAEAIADARFVQVTGSRRYAALVLLERESIEVSVKDGLAESRAVFVAATMAENIDREDYDPIEEAAAIQELVAECGTGTKAAEQLSRTKGWVSQRLNLLKLVPELQSAVRQSEISLREVRDLHSRPREAQLAALESWRRITSSRAKTDERRLNAGDKREDVDEGNGAKGPRRRSPIASAVRRLGGTPLKIAESLRTELTSADRRALAEALLKED